MRPPLHAIAPSQSALRYLRQILFPRLGEHHPASMASNCLRLQRQEGRFRRRLHVETLVERYGGEQQQQQPEKVVPESAPLVERAEAENKSTWATNKQKLPKEQLEKGARKQPLPRKWHSHCRQLVRQKRLNEAMEQWLDARNRNARWGHVVGVGKDLMKAFNENQRTRDTPQVFYGIVSYHPKLVDTRCLNLVLEAYLKNDRPGKLIEVFKHYKEILKPDHMTFNIILRNFIAMKRLDEAENLLQILLETQGPITPSSFATLLNGINQTTGDFQEMRRIVEWMKTTTTKPHTSIYNIMIKAALDNSRYDLARGYAEELVERGLQYNTDTFVLFLSKQSKIGDWVGVRRTLERMHEHNLKISTGGFNTLLNYHASTSELPRTEYFFNSMVSNGIMPDQFSFNIMIGACARSHDDAAKERWITQMKATGFLPDAVTFNILFHELRKSGTQPSLLRRIYRAATSIDPNLVNSRTKHILLDSMYNDEILPYLPRRQPQPEADPFADQTRAMESSLDAGRPDDAICIFSDIMSRGLKPSHPIVAAAIRAAFRLPESEHDESSRLLYIAQERGVPVNEIVLSVIANDSDSYSSGYINSATSTHRLTATLERLKSSYEFMDSKFLTVSHYVLIQAAWNLASDGDGEAAVALIHQIANSRWGASVKWDIVGLTVLLKAYTIMGDLRGIGWVVDQTFQNEIVPDKLFMTYLRRAKEVAQSKEDDDFLGWLVARCLKHRTKLKDEDGVEKARVILKFFSDREG